MYKYDNTPISKSYSLIKDFLRYLYVAMHEILLMQVVHTFHYRLENLETSLHVCSLAFSMPVQPVLQGASLAKLHSNVQMSYIG